MISLVFKLLETGLSLWSEKEAKEYLDELIQLKKDFYEEYNKERPDHAVLDNIDRRLRIISESFASKAGAAYTQNK